MAEALQSNTMAEAETPMFTLSASDKIAPTPRKKRGQKPKSNRRVAGLGKPWKPFVPRKAYKYFSRRWDVPAATADERMTDLGSHSEILVKMEQLHQARMAARCEEAECESERKAAKARRVAKAFDRELEDLADRVLKRKVLCLDDALVKVAALDHLGKVDMTSTWTVPRPLLGKRAALLICELLEMAEIVRQDPGGAWMP
jgi:hypothetical protein